MHQTKVDYIIVGQGIAGSWLSHELLERGRKVMVFNHETQNTASLKAAGLYNPITGRKMVKTWRADALFPTLELAYKELEKKTSSQFLHSIPIYRAFKDVESKNDWDGKQEDASINQYLKEVRSKSYEVQGLNDPLGGIVLNQTGYVNIPQFVSAFRNYLLAKKSYTNELVDPQQLNFKDGKVNYKQYEASRIIFCEGSTTGNPFWDHLPFRYVRGETMDIKSDLKLPFIFNQGVFMIPKKNWITVGSTYDHKVLSYEPQQSGIENLKNRLDKVLSKPYEIIATRAGIRPATFDRKPFIGFHHERKTLAIFNGFGTKGVSLTPYFAKHFADVLENKCEIDKEVDVQRVN